VQTLTFYKHRAATSTAVLLLTLLSIAGCGDVVTEPGDNPRPVPASPPGPITPPAPTGSGRLSISGAMSAKYQTIRVARGGVPVMDAVVTVNGVRIPHCCGDLYSGNLAEPVAGGGALNLKVVAGAVVFEAAGEVSPALVITSPAAGSSFAATDSVTLKWSAAPDPDAFEVCLNCWANSLYGETYTESGSTREFKIAPLSLVDFGGGSLVTVSAWKRNFLKSATSSEVTSNVLFVAWAETLITINH
jgi:hypothetical protein